MDAPFPPDDVQAEPDGRSTPARRPRVMIAGEFSAGKTRLVNALLGEALLPSQVVATALPPVWLTLGQDRAECVDLGGRAMAFASVPDLVSHLQRTDLRTIHHCRIARSSPVLARFDLIDTPGNSDPNAPATAWERMVPHADLILWCSNAVQAWRQSERAAWASLPPALAAQGRLVLSHADRLEPPDREKVMHRVTAEAGGLFAGIHMASFLSEADVAMLLAVLTKAAADLPSLPGLPLPRTEGIAAEPPAPGRIAPRRIRVQPAPGRPSVLVPVLEGGSEAPAAPPEPLIALLRGAAALPEDPVEPVVDAPPEAASCKGRPSCRTPPEDRKALRADLAPGDGPEADPDPTPDSATAARNPLETGAAVSGRRAKAPGASDPAPVSSPSDPDPYVARPQASPAAESHATAMPAMAFGPARMLWMRIAPTLDLDDPDAILEGVERLVQDLDLAWAQAAFAPPPGRRRRDAGP